MVITIRFRGIAMSVYGISLILRLGGREPSVNGRRLTRSYLGSWRTTLPLDPRCSGLLNEASEVRSFRRELRYACSCLGTFNFVSFR